METNMSTKTKLENYRKFKQNTGGLVGYCAAQAWRNANILEQWEKALDNDQVRIIAREECENYFDVYGIPDSEKERKAIERELELHGCWFVTTEYRDENGDWQHADSIGMNTGYSDPTDPFQNCYVPGLMRSALDKVTEPEFSI